MNIGNVCFPVERQHVVLAEGVELDVLDDYHVAVILFEAGGEQNVARILIVSLRQKRHGFGHPLRGLEQTLAGDILSQQFQNGFVVFLQLFDRLGTEYLLFRIVTHRYIRFENRGKSNTLAADNKTEEALRCFEGLPPHSAMR